MSAQLSASLVIQQSTPEHCRDTGRDGTRYISSLKSTVFADEILDLDVIVWDTQEKFEPKAQVFAQGLLSEGEGGAVAHFEVFDDDDGIKKHSGSEPESIITVSGMVHKKYHPNAGSCVVVRLNGSRRQWFMLSVIPSRYHNFS